MMKEKKKKKKEASHRWPGTSGTYPAPDSPKQVAATLQWVTTPSSTRGWLKMPSNPPHRQDEGTVILRYP